MNSFTYTSDPLISLNIGKRTIIEQWLEKYFLDLYELNLFIIEKDLTISCKDNSDSGTIFYSETLDNYILPKYIKFNNLVSQKEWKLLNIK